MENKKIIKDFEGKEHCFTNVVKEEIFTNVDGEKIHMVFADEGIKGIVIANKAKKSTRVDAWEGDESFGGFN